MASNLNVKTESVRAKFREQFKIQIWAIIILNSTPKTQESGLRIGRQLSRKMQINTTWKFPVKKAIPKKIK